MNVYITGLNKGCGKTVISAGIASVMQSLGYKTCVYKPVQCGATDKGKYYVSPDLNFVKLADSHITTHSTYMFKTNALPVVASQIENLEIGIENIYRDYLTLSKKCETVIVESFSNLASPLNENTFSFNIPRMLKTPVVFVITPVSDNVGLYLSEINFAKSIGLDIVGVIINKFQVYSESAEIKSFPALIESYSDVKVLGIIRHFKGKGITVNTLISEIINGIDLQELFGIKIPKLNIY